MKALSWLGVLALAAYVGTGCDSNPTPHPQADATYDTRSDAMVPVGEGPDDDNDGVPDCTAAGGYWDGDACRNDLTSEDALGDTAAPAPDGGDGDDLGDAGEVGPEDDGGVDVADGAAADAGESASDSGPDAAD